MSTRYNISPDSLAQKDVIQCLDESSSSLDVSSRHGLQRGRQKSRPKGRKMTSYLLTQASYPITDVLIYLLTEDRLQLVSTALAMSVLSVQTTH